MCLEMSDASLRLIRVFDKRARMNVALISAARLAAGESLRTQVKSGFTFNEHLIACCADLLASELEEFSYAGVEVCNDTLVLLQYR